MNMKISYLGVIGDMSLLPPERYNKVQHMQRKKIKLENNGDKLLSQEIQEANKKSENEMRTYLKSIGIKYTTKNI